MSDSLTTSIKQRARTFLEASRTRSMLRWTLLLLLAHMLLHLAVLYWGLAEGSEIGPHLSLARRIVFVVGVPVAIYATLWGLGIAVAVLWRGSQRYWQPRV